MHFRYWLALAGVAGVVGCDPQEPEELLPPEEMQTAAAVQQGTVQLNFLYVHGVKGCPAHRLGAEDSLNELQAAVNAALPARVSAYQSAHPGVTVVTNSAHANLY